MASSLLKDSSKGSDKLGSSILSRVESPRVKLSLEPEYSCLLLLILGSS